LVGVSMGGMICAELSEILSPEKTILISSLNMITEGTPTVIFGAFNNGGTGGIKIESIKSLVSFPAVRLVDST
jgi:hypothetical protein